MMQILQNLKTGTTEVLEVPSPRPRPGHLLISTSRSLISSGTERTTVETSQRSLVDRALKQPEKIKTVLNQVMTDGLQPTVHAVRSQLDQLIPMGYCNVGRIIDAGDAKAAFKAGDRVISNGPHAETVLIPWNLCAKIPDGVSDEAAAFTVLGAIALQGLRLAQPTLGESFVVTGLGVIGLLTVQLLRAHGCRVLGIDLDPARLELARRFGAETVNPAQGEDAIAVAKTFSKGRGVDGVIITAATQSSEPMHQAAVMSRKRGRIILVGVSGLELSRADFYEKELIFQVSCSYGPGRYDPQYEQEGRDYPVGFVRWTAQRNFEAFLDMLADGRLDVAPLISHQLPFSRAEEAYQLVTGGGPSLGILLEYPQRQPQVQEKIALKASREESKGQEPSDAVVGVIGAGNYANLTLLPAFKKTDAVLRTITSRGGVGALHLGRRFGFEEVGTEPDAIFQDPELNTVIITTRHDSHAYYVTRALRAGKNVFVEKPLTIHREGMSEIEEAYQASRRNGAGPLLMVGFNRRFAPQIVKMKSLLARVHEAKAFIMTVNAGGIPAEHWTQNPAVGGGRIIGEGCHFIDLLRFLTGAEISSAQVMRMGLADSRNLNDKVSITLGFADGSLGTIHYLANGHKSFPKERLEVFCAGRILQLDNFRRMVGYGWPGFKKQNLLTQDKGHVAGAQAFIDAIKQGKPSPIPFDEILETTRVSIEINERLQSEQ